MIDNMFQFILFIAVLYGYTIVTVLFLRKSLIKVSNKHLSLFVLFFTNYLLWVLVIDLKIYENFQFLLYIPLNLVLAIGPAFYFYVISLTKKESFSLKQHYSHMFPLLFELISHLIIVYDSLNSGDITFGTVSFNFLSPIIQFFGIGSLIIYALKAYIHIKRIPVHESSNKEKRNWLFSTLMFFVFILLSWLLYTIIDLIYFEYSLNIKDYYPLYTLIGIFITWLSINHIFNPHLTLTKLNLIEPINDNDKQLIENLRSLLTKDRLYLNPKLTVADVSRQLGVQTNTISKLINSQYNKNFNKFINDYRVDHFINLLSDETYSAYSLLGLATESGFTSKASFNRVFKDVTGLSPSEHIRKNRS